MVVVKWLGCKETILLISLAYRQSASQAPDMAYLAGYIHPARAGTRLHILPIIIFAPNSSSGLPGSSFRENSVTSASGTVFLTLVPILASP
jgi:hypothetical protein